MTHRDLFWRGLGIGLVGVAVSVRVGDMAGTHVVLSLMAFLLMIAGLVMIVQGKRIPAAFRVERSRHRMLAQAIRNRRRARPREPNP